jgi:uncharacterized membrane protein HdeD (DUF308 family)
MMDHLLIRSPEAIALRGVVAIALGFVALLLPGPTFLALAITFGAFAMADGILALIALFHRHTRLSKGALAFEAITGIGAGLITFLWPPITALALTYLIAAWAFVTGVMKIANAIRLRKQLRHEWLLILSGLVSLAFGALLAMMPLSGIVGVMWAVGIYGVVIGTILLALAVRLRHAGETLAFVEEPEARPRRAA